MNKRFTTGMVKLLWLKGKIRTPFLNVINKYQKINDYENFKFLLTFLVVTTFFASNSYSQGNVKTSDYYDSGELAGIQLPGVPETASASFEGWWTVWNSKTQWRPREFMLAIFPVQFTIPLMLKTILLLTGYPEQ